jgi:hypothetical protein
MSTQDLVFIVVILTMTFVAAVASFAEDETGYQCCTPMGQLYYDMTQPIYFECWEDVLVSADGVEYEYTYCRNRDYIQVPMPDNVG